MRPEGENTKLTKRKAVSPVIATLLLIAIAVAAAIIVYAFVAGLIGNLTVGGSSSLVQVTGQLTVPSGSGPGNLVVNVKNSANNPITSISITSDTANAGNGLTAITANGVSYPNGVAYPMYGGSLPIGQSTASTASATGIVAGSTYTFTVTVNFSGGTSTQIQTLSVTAQI